MEKTVNTEHLIEKFLEFEQNNQLFDLEIGGIAIWHPIRFMVYNEILKRHSNIGEAHSSLSNEKLLRRIILKVKQLPDIVTKNPFWNFKKKDVLIFNHHRRVKNGDYYICLYTDMLLEELQMSSIVAEEPILDKHFKPIKHKNIIYTDYIDLFVVLKRLIFKKAYIGENDIIKINELLGKINDVFDVNFGQGNLGNIICNIVLRYKFMYPYYEKMIDRIQPKAIVEVVSYSLSRFVINAIAMKKNIPTVELQHGTMGKYHIAYNFAEKMDLATFPDYLFLFGEFWKDNTRLPIDDSKIKVVGWPYYEHKVNAYNSKRKINEKRVVLFISQGTIGKHLSKVAVEASEKLGKDNYRIIYKLHPGEYARWKNEYPWLSGKDIEVIDNNKYDMHHYFAQADIQVGVYSTAVFEGLGYGLETYICKAYGYEYMEELYAKNLARLFEDADELVESISNKETSGAKYDISYFWKENSINNTINEISEIIKNTSDCQTVGK